VPQATECHGAGTVQTRTWDKETEKRRVFGRVRKTATESAEVTCSGRLFQARATSATGKVR